MNSDGRLPAVSLFLLSTATLIFEINLTRLFSVAQFYHFAFLIVSVALLGFGASGTFLAIFPGLGQRDPHRSLGWLSLSAGLSILGAFLLTNHLPFDSFSIAWDRRQVLVLVLHYLALALPFFFSGMAVGMLLAASPEAAGVTYAVNLFGAALGCFLALLAPAWLGGEGTVVLSSGMAGIAALASFAPLWQTSDLRPYPSGHRPAVGVLTPVVQLSLTLALVLFTGIDLGLRLSGRAGFSFFELRLSPYKSLSYVLQQPGAEILYSRWNSFSRVDLVRSSGIHSLPGLSYRYFQPLPAQDGLLVDGDNLSPVLRLEPGNETLNPSSTLEAAKPFAGYLSTSLAYSLRPQAEVLILEPRGGIEVLTALALGARQVTAVEANPLIVAAAAPVYQAPGVRAVVTSSRSYLRSAQERYDIIVLSLADSYHPVRSGAYSLSEDYRYTVEAFEDALARLNPQGLLVIPRWLQSPPSEELRAFALAVTALERAGAHPEQQIAALRGYNTATLFVKNGSFNANELQELRRFAAERAFDLVYTPDLRPEEANQYNVLPEPVYYQAFTELLHTRPRQAFYTRYPFEVSPPSDDHPFFGHYFKWSQARQVLAEFGRSFQPFGGAGYFVILALLILAALSAIALILLPVGLASRPGKPAEDLLESPGRGFGSLPALLYFGLIGLAFLLVEIPLIQRFILYLGHPAYALTTVLFALLLFSGLGSRWSQRIPQQPALALLVTLLAGLPFLLPPLFTATLGLSLVLRLGLAVVILAPTGFLMGIPFPSGIRWLYRTLPRNPERRTLSPFPQVPSGIPAKEQQNLIPPSPLIPWVWAVNGAASVIASVLAALLALSFGFTAVFVLGALCYAAAWLTVRGSAATLPAPPRR